MTGDELPADRRAPAASSATSTYFSGETAATRARAWCREHLSGVLGARPVRADLIDDAVLVVSELVTNAVQAGAERTVLTVRVDDEAVTVAATDDIEALPQPRQPNLSDTRGRGLQIVSALCSDWGVTPWGVGKTVWAELSLS
jgi:anti-sigma regulatory factor (Ser/Thr protein kinase)